MHRMRHGISTHQVAQSVLNLAVKDDFRDPHEEKLVDVLSCGLAEFQASMEEEVGPMESLLVHTLQPAGSKHSRLTCSAMQVAGTV